MIRGGGARSATPLSLRHGHWIHQAKLSIAIKYDLR